MAVAMQTENFPFLPSGLEQVNKMIKEHGDLFTDSLCSVCNAVLISESQKLAHYQSKKHSNKVRRYLSLQNEKGPESKKFKPPSCDMMETDQSDPMKICDICKMNFTSSVMAQSHYQGKIHAKNLRHKTVDPLSQAQAAVPVPHPDTDPVNEKHPNRFCSICQACFNNAQMAQQHYVGKKHRKQMAKLNLMKLYGKPTTPAAAGKGLPCTICNIELNSVDQYQCHISGAKHKNQMKKSGLNPSENLHMAQQSPDDENKSVDDGGHPGTVETTAGMGDNQSDNGDYEFGTASQQFGTKDVLFEDTFYALGEDEFVTEGTLFGSADDQCGSLDS
ncbi:zinc finger protein 346 [Dunckerocampus dactyliophorus]|uniref:zinc finger protein 346 n=1 Tax=Dunckerocampus dactyliophorus TaxID=161453 RepID=UPI00240563AA|nr:zinc finger protein 346 [Dunckerocampus dactyliophorus]